MSEQPYATIDPATCGGRIEIECSNRECSQKATNVSRGPWGPLHVAIPLCLDCIEKTDREESGR